MEIEKFVIMEIINIIPVITKRDISIQKHYTREY